MPDLASPALPTPRRARRRLAVAAVAVAAAAAVAGTLIPAAPAGAAAVPAGTTGVRHYFGRGAYEGIRQAVAATPRSCALGDDYLTALVMAPIFKEVSPGLTPQTAPSPMTLSRWDEWTGRHSGSDNMNANYGLYPFRDAAHTPFPRAYWTPGIGVFQYDSAGVGAPYTAAELMDVSTVARDVAAGMAARYCRAGGSGAGARARAAAWQPWAALGGVAKSERFYQDMLAPGVAPFERIGLVDGIEKGGGMQARTCRLGGKALQCWLVDPSRAQGANWWAKDDPTGGARARGEAPLPAPFYVVKRGGFEERHWLRQDTGYHLDISGRRRLGQNARPRDGQPASGVQWWSPRAALCDTARPKLVACVAQRAAARKAAVAKAAAVKKAAAGKKSAVARPAAAAKKKAAPAKARHDHERPRTIPDMLGSLHPGGGYFAPGLGLVGPEG